MVRITDYLNLSDLDLCNIKLFVVGFDVMPNPATSFRAI